MTKAHVDKGSPLAVFRDPEAVTVVGASADPAKWGYWLARGALKGAHRRRVYLVNARGTEIEGQQLPVGQGYRTRPTWCSASRPLPCRRW